MKLKVHLCYLLWLMGFLIGSSLGRIENGVPVVEEGGLCSPTMYHQAIKDIPEAFLFCKAVSDNAGEWTRKECPAGMEFAMLYQNCTIPGHKDVARQPQACNVGSVYQGQGCRWMYSNLNPCANTGQAYLQCSPNNMGTPCGQWQQMPCPMNTNFNAQLQVCVSAQSSCPAQQIPVCSCQRGCPSTTSCYSGTCCCPQPPPVPQLPNCPNGQKALSMCQTDQQCPAGYSCQNTGCCLAPNPPCSDGTTSIQRCQGNGQSTCPTGYDCQNGGCCPMPQCSNGEVALGRCAGSGRSTCTTGYECQGGLCCRIPMCANGQPGTQFCSGVGTCPQGYECANGACCPLPQCPVEAGGLAATQRCSGNNCPNGFYCVGGGCCPLPPCPNGGGTATQTCNGPGICPNAYYCYNNRGCCPIPRCNDGKVSSGPCQVGQANDGCQPNYQCENNGCCPIPIPTCPNGNKASRVCSQPGECGTGNYCFRDNQGRLGCCPVPNCPDGTLASAPCQGTGQSTCPENYQCANGGCCPIPLPTCPPPSNRKATTTCSGVGQGTCQRGNFCYENRGDAGCCPLPNCPDGLQSTDYCTGTGQSSCGTGFECINGGCCPQNCPNGDKPIQTCPAGSVCPRGYDCTDAICCRLPACTGGTMASRKCATTQECPSGEYCNDNRCCPLPTCPEGQRPTQECQNGVCPPGSKCFEGLSCCPLKPCSSGDRPTQECGTGNSCPAKYFCESGSCCPEKIPFCPNGQQAIQTCTPGVANNCPLHYQCQNGGCCPEQKRMPLCDNGQPAIALCTYTANSVVPGGGCPNGYQCGPSGGCCPIPPTPPPQPVCPTPVCPVIQPTCIQPVCQCAMYNNACPYGTNCNGGLCCAGATSVLFQTVSPGGSCQSSTQCGGYPANSGCMNGFCSCMNGARSNGVLCTSQRLRYKPGSSLDQFGTKYSRKLFSRDNVKRRPSAKSSTNGLYGSLFLLMDETQPRNDTLPEFWHPAPGVTHCFLNADCTPDMVCINNSCHMIKHPGDLDCESDEQCVNLCDEESGDECPSTQCSWNQIEGEERSMCACEKGSLIHDFECVKSDKCPEGTKQVGIICIDFRDPELFEPSEDLFS